MNHPKNMKVYRTNVRIDSYKLQVLHIKEKKNLYSHNEDV